MAYAKREYDEIADSMPITKARGVLTKLPEQLGNKALALTRRGTPVLAVLPWEIYESMVETMEILGDPEMMAHFRKGVEDAKAGRVYTMKQLEDRLG